MAFQVSPGVQIKEIDLSNVVPAVSSTVGAFAGVFQWGPVDEVKTVSSGQQLVDEFYKPADSDLGTEDFYSADSFLRYGSALKVVRISNSAMKSANSLGASSALLKNETDYESTYESGGQNGTVGRWISKYAGVLGNSLQVSVCASNNAYFNSGASAINNADGYSVGATTVTVDAGADATAPTTVEKISAWDAFFADAETQDFSFLVIGSTRSNNGDTVSDHNTLVNSAVSLAELRKDCLVIASPRKTSIVNVSSEASQLANVEADFTNVTSSSYLVIDSGWVYQYDRFNDKYVWVPGNGHTAGIMARSDLLQDPWYSPAGFSRGQYLGITKLAFNPKQASRDELYRKRINPIVTFPGQGTVLFGDKTGLASPSAFDRINVRRLFIVLEKAISIAAKAQLFEFNDAFTRAQFRSAVEPFLRDVKNRRGLIDFSVVCDESNNTDSVIDRNEFVCSIFVKPAKSINFITLNFVASRSGVEFEEIYGAV